MIATAAVRASRLLAVVMVGFLVAACSPATVAPSPSASPPPGAALSLTPSPTPSPSDTPAPTPSPSENPSVAPSASTAAAPDPAEGLAIAPPFTLASLDPVVDAAFRRQFTASAGGAAGLVDVGGRNALKSGALAGVIFVIAFPTGLMTDAAYQTLLTGLQTSMKATLTATTISGTKVSSGATPTGGLGVFRVGDHVILVLTPASTDVTPVATALITANS
jgi:hypothetical protein